MGARRYVVPVTSDASQVATVFSPWLSGYVQEIHYIKDGSNAYTDGVDFAITAEATGETIWAESNVNASATRAPRLATHSTVGVALLYAAGGANVSDRIALGRDRIKIVLAQAGVSKTGKFHIVMVD
jgi:hypothetical protein